jgi:hypothetical protein
MAEKRITRQERQAAYKLSWEIDCLLATKRGKGEKGKRGTNGVPVGDPLLQTAYHLSQINDHLPPVPQALASRVRTIVGSGRASTHRPLVLQQRGGQARSALWGALAAAALLIALWTVTPGGQTAWAQMMQTLHLGQTRVEVTPTLTVEQSRAVREPLRDLVEVELRIGRAPAVPKVLPEGFALQEIVAVSYPDLPAWISQPFYIELCYGIEGGPTTLCLREYRLLFREYGGISGERYPGETIADFERVEIGGVTGALLTISDGGGYVALWERDGLLLELSSTRGQKPPESEQEPTESGSRPRSHPLSREELLQIAQTVR